MGQVIDLFDYKETRELPPKLTETYGVIMMPDNKTGYVVLINPQGKLEVSQLVSDPRDYIRHFIDMTDGDEPFVLFLRDLPHADAQEEELDE